MSDLIKDWSNNWCSIESDFVPWIGDIRNPGFTVANQTCDRSAVEMNFLFTYFAVEFKVQYCVIIAFVSEAMFLTTQRHNLNTE